MAKFKKVYCKNCNKTIYRSTGRFNENMKLGHNFYCSRKCEYQYKTKKRKLICKNCGKIFLRPLNAISPHNYCSSSCAAIINNKRYPKKHPRPEFRVCVKCGKRFRKSTGNKKYCSLKCRREAERHTPKEILEIIKDTVQRLGRIPARRELRGIDGACRRFFGSWNNAVAAAGFEPNRSHSDRMYKRIIIKALDGHFCDSASEAIIDNWLTKNNIAHERDIHYPNTHHKADWGIVFKNQKIFVEYFSLVNDSPRYDRAIKKKKQLCQKNNISLIEIYPKDIFPRNFLNQNLKNKFKKFFED